MDQRKTSITAAATALLAALVTLATGSAVSAQRRKDPQAWRHDPYTDNDPRAMSRAGYVSFGPFPFGDHDTAEIDHVLGEATRMLWVETAHFRIGSSLPEYRIPRPDKRQREKLAGELRRLRKVLPRVKPKTKVLDRWLRLHLTAQRLESLYADFCALMKVTDTDFPTAKGELVHGKYMGEGPYLGQPAKFTVLLFAKKSSAGQYEHTFLHTDTSYALRYNFVDSGSLLTLDCVEYSPTLQDDTALHCELVFHTVHWMVDGYRYFWHPLPHWFGQGFAQWHLRQISPEYPQFHQHTRYDNNPDRLWNWPPRVRARVKFGVFPPASELMAWKFDDEKTLIQAMMIWSRVDYLMSLGEDGIRTYIDAMNAPYGRAGAVPSDQEVLKRQKEVMRSAWKLDDEAFDRAWSTWVLETYPKR